MHKTLKEGIRQYAANYKPINSYMLYH